MIIFYMFISLIVFVYVWSKIGDNYFSLFQTRLTENIKIKDAITLYFNLQKTSTRKQFILYGPFGKTLLNNEKLLEKIKRQLQ